MTREGICLIAEKPLAFAAKSLVEMVDLFQINYTGAERFTGGFTTGRLPPWYALSLFLLDDTLYVLVLPLALLGWGLIRRPSTNRGSKIEDRGSPRGSALSSILYPRSSILGLLGLWLLYNIALAPLLFAINRFRLPLLPFAFILAAYAIVVLARGGWRLLRDRGGLAWAALAIVLTIVATTPYAYLWPNNQTLPSYLGPYPSSIASTIMGIKERGSYRRTEQLRQALLADNQGEAHEILASWPVIDGPRESESRRCSYAARRAARRAARPARRWPCAAAAARRDRRGQGCRGRRRARRPAAQPGQARRGAHHVWPQRSRATRPALWTMPTRCSGPGIGSTPRRCPATHLDLAGDLDLGYIVGCFLGEGDPQGTFRWCSDGAQLRFPGAGTGAPQTLALRADGRGWLTGWLPVPPVQRLPWRAACWNLHPSHDDVREFAVTAAADAARRRRDRHAAHPHVHPRRRALPQPAGHPGWAGAAAGRCGSIGPSCSELMNG